ncbi:MAG TPA: ABC transporter ATP-binding protein [Candidatus Limnocylindria bacterium]|nr:ABC transporter ATP-binding protein [Candidatus Limnocylindria bacterium]
MRSSREAGAPPSARVDPVAVREVVKVYGTGADAVRALDGVSLDLAAGAMVALVGPSGCGKSTLLNLIGCVDLPTAGEVRVDGQATTALDDDALTLLRRDRVGTVFQFFQLLPALRVADNVALPLVLQRVARDEIDVRVSAALASVGLQEKARAYPAELSGGQQQRVAIARATVHRPAILLADEPTGNLDSQTGATVLRLLRAFADAGQTILMATHSDAAAAICDRAIRMQDGRIVG